jgi:putative lipase involved disintegration of autophagic bodies
MTCHFLTCILSRKVPSVSQFHLRFQIFKQATTKNMSMYALSETTTTTVKSRISRRLPLNYKLGKNDVYVGRSNLFRYHSGNIRFNEIIQSNLERYYNASKRQDKTSIIYDVVDQVLAGCTGGGGFVKRSRETGRWYEVGDVVAVSMINHRIF